MGSRLTVIWNFCLMIAEPSKCSTVQNRPGRTWPPLVSSRRNCGTWPSWRAAALAVNAAVRCSRAWCLITLSSASPVTRTFTNLNKTLDGRECCYAGFNSWAGAQTGSAGDRRFSGRNAGHRRGLYSAYLSLWGFCCPGLQWGREVHGFAS